MKHHLLFYKSLMSMLNRIHYTITGPKSEVIAKPRRWVFVHGLMGYSNNWRKITSMLEETEQCLSYDQRGHGRSFKPETGYSPEDYAWDLKKLTDELGWDKFILVGHSMGGRNVLVFASLFPEKIEKLIVEDIGPEAKSASVGYYESLLGVVPTPFQNREQARDFFQNEFPLKAKTKEPVRVLGAFLNANLEEKDNGMWDWRFSKNGVIESVRSGRDKDRWQEIENLKIPTLWIRGENSQELPVDVYQRILQSNKMIQGVEIAQAGHWIHSERPQEFTQALKNFVGGF